MRNWFYITALLLIVSNLWSQTSSIIVKKQFQIGEQTELIYEILLANESDKLRFEPKVGLISCDPYSEAGKLKAGDKINLEIIGDFEDSISYGNPLKWVGKYKITAWDTGYFEIPAPSIVLNDSTVDFQAVRFKVVAPESIQGQGIYETEIPFVDIPEDRFYWWKQNWWWISIVILSPIVWLVYRKLQSRKPTVEVKEISLKEKTLMAIDALDNARLWEKNQLKTHYIEMSYILRAYLGARYELNLLERTSEQARLLLIAQGLSQDTVKTIQLILDQSDMVKFAKSAPSEVEIYKISALAKQIVAETSPIEFHV